MVQRFCLVSLTISNRKTSYRSHKKTAGSTSCQWTTILVNIFNYYICSFLEPNTSCQIENFSSRIGEKYRLLGFWEWGRILASNFGDEISLNMENLPVLLVKQRGTTVNFSLLLWKVKPVFNRVYS